MAKNEISPMYDCVSSAICSKDLTEKSSNDDGASQKRHRNLKTKRNAANPKETSQPRLTRAKTILTETRRSQSHYNYCSDDEYCMGISFDGINLDLESHDSHDMTFLDETAEGENPESFSYEPRTSSLPASLTEEVVEIPPDFTPMPELDDSIEVFRSDPNQSDSASRSTKSRPARTVKSKIPQPVPTDDVEVSRMSRIRPLQASSETNKSNIKDKKHQVKARLQSIDTKKTGTFCESTV
jgi:hypothetical protein